jgi:hypothetical protein
MNNIPAPAAPAPDWQSYLCRINDERASVYVDLAFESVAPLPQTSKLAWLWIRLNHSREDGLSSDEEFEALCDFEDELEGLIGRRSSSIYVGRITTLGRREFYFYVTKAFEFATLVNILLEARPEYSFQVGEKADEQWRHYFKTLLPGPGGWEQIKKRRSTE